MSDPNYTELSATSASPSSASASAASEASSSAARSQQHLALVDSTNEPMRNYDGTEMRDANSCIVYKSQFLSTHPLRSDCKERVGYAGMKLTYVSGDGVIRTMNAIFGHGGWSSQITMQRNILNEKDDRGRWNVGYITSIRVTLLNGASHEDSGSGEGIDNSKIKAHDKAIKSAITDGMKRAARHFGERLGNALYVKGSGIRTAPKTNREALLELERKDSLNLFGDQAVLRENHLHSPDETQRSIDASTTASSSTISASTNNEVRNDKWQQNRIGSTMNHVANLCNPRPSSNHATGGQQILQQQHTGLTGLSVLPSPIPSSTGTHGSSSYSHVASLSTQVNNHLLPRTTSTSIAPRPPLLTAPPTRPSIYNPGVMGGHVNSNGKRDVDGIENQYPMNNSNTNNVNGYSIGDNNKRMRANPYNSKTDGSNRLSV